MSNYTQYPQPQRKKINPWPWIGVGCAAAVIGIGAFVGVIVSIVIGAMRSTDAYQTGMRVARNDLRVIEALGTPIEPGLFITGQVKTMNDSGWANITVPIRGPKGKARLRVVGSKQDGKWSYNTMTVTPERGEPIDLLQREVRSAE